MKKVMMVAAFVSLAGCQTMQDINDGLADINAVLAVPGEVLGDSSSALGFSQMDGVARIAPEQEQQIADFLANKTNDTNLDTAITEALPNIQPILQITSCGYHGRSAEYLNRYAAPGKDFTYTWNPPRSAQYHDNKDCMNVVRVHGWEMPARNALTFETVYESPSSGEIEKRYFQMIRQSSGEWLLSTYR